MVEESQNGGLKCSLLALNEALQRALGRQGKPDLAATELPPDTVLTDALVSGAQITLSDANALLEEATGFTAINPQYISFAPVFLEHIRLLIPRVVATAERVLVIKHECNHVHLLMANPLDEECVARMEALTNSRIHRYVCATAGILQAIQTFYPADVESPAEDMDMVIDQALRAVNRIRNEGRDDHWKYINNAYVIRLLRLIFHELVQTGASDIHIEPQRDCLRVRSRQDGVLYTVWSVPLNLKLGIIPRLKMISGVNLEIDDAPQDGRIDYHLVSDREIDVRVSVLPAIHGEKIVMRILDKGKNRLTLKDLDLEPHNESLLLDVIHRPNGLLLVTGPTGSGKTSTLYAFLAELNQPEVNISTAEDPVEYELHGITQVNCAEGGSLTFSRVLRSFLRQDPDVIMVGEIRDLETADMAVKAALTGHLVLSTLHTNDAPGAVARIVNLGVPPFLIASCGLTVLAQRLIRKVCGECREVFTPEASLLKALGLETDRGYALYRGRGCEKCRGTGYKGRIAVMEILTVNDEIERMILEQRAVSDLMRAAIDNGMTTLRQAALAKMLAGLTSPEEVLRVTLEV